MIYYCWEFEITDTKFSLKEAYELESVELEQAKREATRNRCLENSMLMIESGSNNPKFFNENGEWSDFLTEKWSNLFVKNKRVFL